MHESCWRSLTLAKWPHLVPRFRQTKRHKGLVPECRPEVGHGAFLGVLAHSNPLSNCEQQFQGAYLPALACSKNLA